MFTVFTLRQVPIYMHASNINSLSMFGEVLSKTALYLLLAELV